MQPMTDQAVTERAGGRGRQNGGNNEQDIDY